MIGVFSDYVLILKISDVILPLQPGVIKEITLSQDLDSIVPSVRIALNDASGNLTHLLPYDAAGRRISLEYGRSIDSDQFVEYNFRIVRRSPQVVYGLFECEAVLDVPNLYDMTYHRGWEKQVSSVLSEIAEQEFQIPKKNQIISQALNCVKPLVQPGWTTIKWLRYLSQRLEGKNGEYGWYVFFPHINGQQGFVFTSYSELIQKNPSYTLMVNEQPVKGSIPFLDIQIYDHTQLLALHSPQRLQYYYTDFDGEQILSDEVRISDIPSLTIYYGVDSKDSATGIPLPTLGRTNDFNKDYSVVAKTAFVHRLVPAIQLCGLVPGLVDINPGDVVEVIWPEAMLRGEYSVYQHSGLWLVYRTIHSFAETFSTRLILSRFGVDTDQPCSLIGG